MALRSVDLPGTPDPGGVDVVLAPMHRRHLRSVVRIEESVYPRPWTSGLFLSELAQAAQRTYLVAKVDGRVVGYAGAMYVLPDAHVTTVAVDPERQRSAIGTRLLLGLCEAALERGATALTLEVRVSNEPAQALYRRFGFVPAGARKAYYPPDAGHAEGEDALVMWAHDIDQPEFRRRIDAIAAAVPGTTRLERDYP
jgi:ribosomal-protein-alanine N-acetyltransferase